MHKVRCAATELGDAGTCVARSFFRIYEMMMQYYARLSVLESLLHGCMSRACSNSELGDGLRESAIRTEGYLGTYRISRGGGMTKPSCSLLL
jgi:hypothetical protein